MEYIFRQIDRLPLIRPSGDEVLVPADIFRRALSVTHRTIDRFRSFEVDVFAILGMRNLSAFLGELFCHSVVRVADGLFVKNPHQDGYPDLLLMDGLGRAAWARLAQRLSEKEPFSPFALGGIEVKATCGSVPTPAACRRRGLAKPGLGDQRIALLQSYDWKAHHRDTNNLLGLLWDFIAGTPRVVAAFYAADLTNSDWGRIVTPRKGGGRTTSVSIMSRDGIRKMYEGWLFVVRDDRYVDFIDRYNSGDLLRQALNSSA